MPLGDGKKLLKEKERESLIIDIAKKQTDIPLILSSCKRSCFASLRENIDAEEVHKNILKKP